MAFVVVFTKLIAALPQPVIALEEKLTAGRGDTTTVCETEDVQPLLSVAVRVVV